MALGMDMKSLVEDIQASRDTRKKILNDIKKDTHYILGEAKTMLRGFIKEGEERVDEVKKIAKDVKVFLKSSEENRQEDFNAVMKTVNETLKDVKKDVDYVRHTTKTIINDAKELLVNIKKENKAAAIELREELKKSEHERKVDFNGVMGNIQEDLKDTKKSVDTIKKDTRDMISRYHHSRMTARKHWASLSTKEISRPKNHKEPKFRQIKKIEANEKPERVEESE